jgi:hypothetical protein
VLHSAIISRRGSAQRDSFAGVFAGSALWWLVLSVVIGTLRRSLTPQITRAINVASGITLTGFGTWALTHPDSQLPVSSPATARSTFSGTFDRRMYEFPESEGIEYAIRLTANQVLRPRSAIY